jgi:hypothetical protein
VRSIERPFDNRVSNARSTALARNSNETLRKNREKTPIFALASTRLAVGSRNPGAGKEKVAVYEGSEIEVKALAKAVAAIKVASTKVVSEVEYFRTALATVGIDFDALSPEEAIACQDVLFAPWQGTSGRRSERDAEKLAREVEAAKAKLANADAADEADDEAEKEIARRAARIRERREEREALRAKFGALLSE